MRVFGTYAAMMTPFDENGDVALGVVCEMVEFLIEKGVMGIFPVSNVGEQIQLSGAQKRELIRTVVRQVRGRVPVMPGISAAGTHQSVELGMFCREEGADGVVLSAPFYFSYPQQVVGEALMAVARRVSLPVVLYNIPKFANPIEADTLEKLFQAPNVIGIKDSSGSISYLLDIVSRARDLRPDFSVLVGWEEMLYSAMGVGASGCMTASVGIFPEIMADLYKSTRDRNHRRALDLQYLISVATSQMKSLFSLMGIFAPWRHVAFPWGRLLLPLTRAPMRSSGKA